MLSFERLIVWRKAMDLSSLLIKIADALPAKYQYSFGNQLRRAAISIPSNIAEGQGERPKGIRLIFIPYREVRCMNV